MSRQSMCISVLSLVIVSVSFVAEASAQNRLGHRPLRWLGQGFGDGYHRCNPGHDSSHYNPYSAHNTFLYSQTPQYRALTGTQNYAMSPNQDLRFRVGVPYSTYAAPPRNNPLGHFQDMPRATIDNSFEPTKREDAIKSRSTNSDDNTFENGSIFDGTELMIDGEDALPDPNQFIPDNEIRGLDGLNVDDSPLPNPNQDTPAFMNEAPSSRKVEELEQPLPAPEKPSDGPVNLEVDSDSSADEYELITPRKSAFQLPVLNGTGLAPFKRASTRTLQRRK